jgi:Carboxypeptidase regulatory-like domain
LIELGGLVLCSPAQAQAQPAEQPQVEFRAPKAALASGDAEKAQQQDGIVVGRVIDPMGEGIAGADVVLMRDRESVLDQVQSDDNGRFTFPHVTPGSLQLRIVADGFATKEISGTMLPGENYVFPEVSLSLATQFTEIRVSPPPDEIAEEQFKDEEKQRVFGILPNFYVSYTDNTAPLTPKRKFQLALKAMTDPVSISAVSTIAAVDQASDRFSGYGQGATGYAKRYGASYTNFASGLFIGGAVLPSILKQDPRYFYRGAGTKRSRFLYAVSRVFICKGDNQLWQPNYSSVLGDLAAGGLSNLYIPEKDHHGARLTFTAKTPPFRV